MFLLKINEYQQTPTTQWARQHISEVLGKSSTPRFNFLIFQITFFDFYSN